MSRLPRALAPLREQGFRLLAIGQLTSNVGDAFYAVALPWYVLAHHGGVVLLGTVLAAYGVPRTALILVGGHASDRFSPWAVMMGADTVRAVAVALLAAVAATGPARAVYLVPIAVVLGAGEGMFLPGSMSIIPRLLPDEHLQSGNALSSSGTELSTLVGPAIGGLTVAAIGSAPAFAIDAATFLVSAVSLARIRRVMSKASAAAVLEPSVEGEAEGGPTLVSVLKSERIMWIILAVVLAANLGSGAVGEVALPALAHGPFHAGAAGYGGLIAGFGAGGLVGAIAAAQVHGLRRPAIVGSAAFLLAGVFLAVAPYLGGAAAAGVAIFLFGAFNGFGNVLMLTLFQRWAPPALLGRLMSFLLVASFGVFPVSVALGGLLVRALGPAPVFPLSASFLALAIVGGLTQRQWRRFGSETSEVAPLASVEPAEER